MKKSAYIRSATRELIRGQILLGFCDHETDAILTWQKVLELAIDRHFGMLFAVFTRLNSALNRFKGKQTVERAQRSKRVGTRLLKSVDQWKVWEEARRARYRKRLQKEHNATQDLSTDKH